MKIILFLFIFLSSTFSAGAPGSVDSEYGFQELYILENRAIMFMSYSLNDITVWWTPQENLNLAPKTCRLNIETKTCIEFESMFSTASTSIRSIKESSLVDKKLYIVNGVNYPEMCEHKLLETPFCYFGTEKLLTEPLFMVSTEVLIENIGKILAIDRNGTTGSRVILHKMNGAFYEMTTLSSLPIQNPFDFKYQNGQYYLFYWEENPTTGNRSHKLRLFGWGPEMTSGIGEFEIQSTSERYNRAVIETNDQHMVICFGYEMIRYVFRSSQPQPILIPNKRTFASEVRCQMKLAGNYLFVIEYDYIVRYFFDPLETEQMLSSMSLFDFPTSVTNPEKLVLEYHSESNTVFMFEKGSNILYSFIWPEEWLEEEEEEIEPEPEDPETIPNEEQEEREIEEERKEEQTPENEKPKCAYECLYCESEDICIECKVSYSLNEKRQCEFPVSSQLALFATNVLSTVRPFGLQSFFFIFVDFDLYNIHKTEYSGFFYEVISFADSVLETLWDVLPVPSIKEYMEKPLTEKYLPFTNEKFVDATKKDTLFLNSVKNFILLYSPLTLISFVCVNLLRRVSRIVRSFQSLKTFDFWMYFLVANKCSKQFT